MAMRRATLCVDTFGDDVERNLLNAWFDRWQYRLASCSENLGCGCCIDMFDVEAPEEALAELPGTFLADSDWSRPS